MPKQRKRSPVEEPSYEVECINAARVTEDAQWEYNIKWGGYSEDENSWEPEGNLGGCARMMADFWQQVGVEHKLRAKLYPVDHQVTPSALWIKRQRDSYKTTHAKKKTQKQKLKTIKSDDDDDDDDDNGRTTSSSSSTPSFTDDESYQSSPKLFRDDSDDDDPPLTLKTKVKEKPSVPNATVAGRNIETLRPSSSKRKLDDDLSHEPLNKRLKTSAVESRKVDVGTDVGTARKDNDESSRAASPQDSLFGDGSESDDVPLASHSLPQIPRTVLVQPLEKGLPAQSSIPPEVKFKEKPKIPLHIQRRQNPRVKPMALPPIDSSFGGISTKHRILSQTNLKFANPGVVKSSAPDGLGSPSSAIDSPNVSKSAAASDASAWLRENIMSKDELTRPAPKTSRPSSAEPTSTALTAQHLPRFSKRWRWTGQLAVGDNEAGLAEIVGGIVITDNTPLDRNAGHLSVEALLPSHVDTICLHHYHTLTLLRSVLRDYKLSQFAVMTANQSDGENFFDDVVSYMAKGELFSQSHLTISDLKVATLFVFPSDCLHLLDNLNVPAKVCHGSGLIVAIGFKAYEPPKRILGGSVSTYTEDWKTDSTAGQSSDTRSPECIQALLALNFPENLFQRLSNKQCTIFTSPSDKELPGHDTLALISVLEGVPGCTILSLAAGNARFIFIHVNSWSMLHKLPGLVDRRLRRPDVQFYTYGSDPSVERKRWGIHEVFPLGGVVTFTPRAIVEDPTAVAQLIANLDEHPLWACYIIPSVIPMICEIAAEKDSEYIVRSGIEALCSILLPMEKGQMDLSWHLPSFVAHDPNSGPKWVDWVADQGRLSELQGNELVVECRNRFNRQPNRSEEEVMAQIVDDFLVMQSDLRKEYRRFVIITDTTGPSNTSREVAATSSGSKADVKDGFELTHVRDFIFNDDYFVKDST